MNSSIHTYPKVFPLEKLAFVLVSTPKDIWSRGNAMMDNFHMPKSHGM